MRVKNKALFIVFFIVACLGFMSASNKVFGYSSTYTLSDGSTVDLSTYNFWDNMSADGNNAIVILKTSKTYYYVFTYNHDTNKLYVDTGTFFLVSRPENNNLIRYSVHFPEGDTMNSWNYGDSYSTDSFPVYTSDNIYSYNHQLALVSDTVVFQGALKQGELVQVMNKVENKDKVLQEVVGLLPLIIVILVSFLGLRKGLTFLRNLLVIA